jgi:prophage regulatory protein
MNDMQMLTCRDLEELLKISKATIYRWMEADDFPKPLHLGAKMIRWRSTDIEKWLADKDIKSPITH